MNLFTIRVELFFLTQRIEPILNLTQRIEPFFECDSKIENFWLTNSQNIELFPKNMTQRIEPFSFNTTQRIEHFFFHLTQRIEHLFFHLTQRIDPFYQEVWLKELSRVSKKDSKNVTLVKGLIELNLFSWTSCQYDSKSWSLFFNMTRRIEPFLFSNVTQRIVFFKMLKELNLSSIWITFWHSRIELFFFDQYDSKSRISSQKMTQSVEPFRNMTHRIEFFWNEKDSQNWTLLFTHRSEPFFSTWLTVLNPSFQHVSKNFFLIDSKKIEPCVKRKVSKSGTFFYSEVKNCFLSFSTWLEELNLFFNMSQWIEPFSWIWPTELNLFFNMFARILIFSKIMTHWIEPFCKKDSKNVLKNKNDSKNWFFEYNSQNRTTFLKKTQRIEPIFLNATWKIELLLKNTKNDLFEKLEKIKPFAEKYDSKNWTLFSIRLNELNPFDRWLAELNPFLKMIHRFFFEIRMRLTELDLFSLIWLFQKESNNWIFQYDSKNWNSFYEPLFNMTQRHEVFFHLTKNWNPLFSQNVSQNWTSLSFELFFYTTQRIELFSTWRKDFFKLTQKSWTHFFPWLKETTLFLQNDAQNWTLILNMTQRMEYDAKNWILFLWIWRKELNPFSFNETHRIESFFCEYDAKNWTLCLKWLGELNLREQIAQRLETSFFELDSKNWTFFQIDSKILNTFQRVELFSIRLKESNLFFECDSKIEIFCLKNSQNIELFPKIWLKELNFSQKIWCKGCFFFEKNLIRRMEPSWKYDFQTKTWLK